MCAWNKRSKHLKPCMQDINHTEFLPSRYNILKNYVVNKNKSFHSADMYIYTVRPQIFTKANFCPHAASTKHISRHCYNMYPITRINSYA